MAIGIRIVRRLLARLTVAAALLAVGLLPMTASAQDGSLQLKLRRTFGYSWGSDIQGSFLLSAEGPGDLEQVTFHVDDQVLESVSAPPFQARLHTGDYPLGPHRLWAKGTLDDGSEVVSNEILAEFVDPSAGWESAAGMLIPILVIVGLAIAARGRLHRRFQPEVQARRVRLFRRRHLSPLQSAPEPPLPGPQPRHRQEARTLPPLRQVVARASGLGRATDGCRSAPVGRSFAGSNSRGAGRGLTPPGRRFPLCRLRPRRTPPCSTTALDRAAW